MVERNVNLPPESIKGLELIPDTLKGFFQKEDWKQNLTWGIGKTARGRLRFLPAINSKVENWVETQEKKRGFLDEINNKVDGVLIKSAIVKTSALAHERNLTVVQQILADEYAGVDRLVIDGKDVFKASRKYKNDPDKALESKVRSLLKVYKKQQETGEVNFSTEVQEALKEIAEEKKGLSKDKRSLTRYKSEIKAWGKWYYYLNNQGNLDRMIENGMPEAEDLAPAELLGYRTSSSKRFLVAKLYEFSQGKATTVKPQETQEEQDDQIKIQAEHRKKSSLVRKLAVAGVSATMILAANFFINTNDINIGNISERVLQPAKSYEKSDTLYASSNFIPAIATSEAMSVLKPFDLFAPTETPHPGASLALATLEAKLTEEAIPTETVTPVSTFIPEPTPTPVIESINTSTIIAEEKVNTINNDNALTRENLYREFLEYRKKQELSLLSENPLLCRVAEQRLEDVKENSSLLNHGKFITRWYEVVKSRLDYVMGGENLARNTKTASATIEAWDNSPSHQKNLLGPYDQVCFATDGTTAVQILGLSGEPGK